MYLRKLNGWELWGSVHPASVGCVSEGKPQCDCKYHVIDEKRNVSIGFDNFKDADFKYRELSGDQTFEELFIHRQ